MASVVQATCPGCKNILRIPGEWVAQAIRCKNCGLIMQARQPAASVPAPPPPVRPSPKVQPVRPPTSPVPQARTLPPSPPVARIAPVATIVPGPAAIPLGAIARPAPVGMPVPPPSTDTTATSPSSRWKFDTDSSNGPIIRRPRPKSHLKLILFSGALLCILSAAAIIALTPSLRERVQKAWAALTGQEEKISPVVVASVTPPKDPPSDTPKPKDPPTDTIKPKDPPAVTIKPKDPPAVTIKPKDPPAVTIKPKDPPTDTIKPKDPPTDTTKPKDPPTDTTKPKDPPPSVSTYPRRLLFISVHNYLFANPIGSGAGSARSISKLVRAFSPIGEREGMGKTSVGLNIPKEQVWHLSDVTGTKDKDGLSNDRPPLRGLIDETLTTFLTSARAQDRVMVFFVGHSVEIEGKVYLVPIEGEMDNALTLIPLTDVFDKMAKCPARQKILVLDVNRFSPVKGTERPGSGLMGTKFETMLKTPPPGVQVWAACRAEQQSYESDYAVMGHFLDAIYTILRPNPGELSLASGKIQRADDPIPLERMQELVNEEMKKLLTPQKFAQQSNLTGAIADSQVSFNPKELAKPLGLIPMPVTAAANINVVRDVLKEVGLPPVKPSNDDTSLNYKFLPPFLPDRLAAYVAGPAPAAPSKLREKVEQARILLWATDDGKAMPQDIEKLIQTKRNELKIKSLITLIKEGYGKPANEKQFKDQIFNDERDVARILGPLMDIEQELIETDIKEERDKENKRWQANYDFMLARVQAEIAFLFEYQSMLGQMRKDNAPPLDPKLHTRWKLAAATTLSGDSTGKRMAKSALKLYDSIIKENPGTPWEVLAKREKMTALGLEWKPSSATR